MARPRPIAWLSAHPAGADALLAVVVAAVAVTFHLTIREPSAADPSAVGVLATLVATVPVAFRRRSPLAVLAVVAAGQAWAETINAAGSGWMGVLIAAYTVGANRSGRLLASVGSALVVIATGFTVLGVFVSDVPWQAVFSIAVTMAGALVVGDSVRRRRERQAELVERAERAERERDLLAQQRVQHERTRIARELHDVVAHSLSVMTIQAAAAQRTSDEDAARRAMASIELTGRQAMTEMRRILGVLRDDSEATLAPMPSIGQLHTLIDQSDDLPVRLHTDDLDELPPGVELSVYRIVQEGLTNVRRHAGPVRAVEVAVRRAPDAVVVEIDDDGRGATADTDAGLGLTGMRERVAMHAGSFSAGPRPGGGWRVRAVIPVGG